MMGLVVGEGYFAGHPAWGPSLVIELHEDDPEPLRLMQRLLGGRTCGLLGPLGRAPRLAPRLARRATRARTEGGSRWLNGALPASRKRRQLEDWEVQWWRELIGRWQRWAADDQAFRSVQAHPSESSVEEGKT